MKRLFLSLLALLFAGLLGAGGWLLATESGLQALAGGVAGRLPGEVAWQALSGRLIGPLRIQGLVYEDDSGLGIRLDSLELDWQPAALLHGRLRLRVLHGSGIQVRLPKPRSGDHGGALPGFPLGLRLEDGRIEGLRIERDGQPLLEVVALRLAGGPAGFDFDGRLGLAQAKLPEGVLDLSGHGAWMEGRLVLEAGRVTVPGSPAGLNLRGDWQPESGRFQARLDWQNLQWPLAGDPAWSSREGQARVEGEPDGYRIEGQAEVRARDYPLARADWRGEGDAQGLRLQPLSLRWLGGLVEARGRVAWAGRAGWEARFQGRDLDPGILLPGWPGRMGFDLTTRGSWAGGRITAGAELQRLEGQLREQPVQGQGRVRLDEGGALSLEGLSLAWGGVAAEVRGRVAESWALDWQLSVADLGGLAAGAAGTLQAKGRMEGPRDRPRLIAEAGGSSLRLRGMDVARARMQGQGELAGDRAFELSLDLERPAWRGLAMEHLQLRGRGGRERQSWALEGVNGDERMDVAVETALAGGGRLNGKVTRATWAGAEAGTWRLEAPLEFRRSPRGFSLDEGCWQDGGESRLCLAMEARPDGELAGQVRAMAMPLGLITRLLWVESPLSPEGIWNLEAEGRWTSEKGLEGKARLELPPGAVRLTGEAEKARFAYQGGRVSAEADARGMRGAGRLETEAGEGISFDWQLPPLRPGGFAPQAPVAAKLVMDIGQLGLLEAMLDQVGRLRGRLHGELNLAGTWGQPRTSGAIQWLEGGMEIQEAGIDLHDLRLKLEGDDSGGLRLSGGAVSGEGQLALEGRLLPGGEHGWQASARLEGDRFLVMDTSEVRLLVSPDIRARAVPGRLDMEGTLEVPEAEFRPRSLPVPGQVVVSRDTEVVSQAQEKPRHYAWQVYSRLRLLLGRKVWLDAYGLQGWLEGDLEVTDEPGGIPLGSGELAMRDGRLRFQGQPLTIARGRLLFRKSPVDNPALDVEANRQVDNIRVGVRMTGTLKAPVLRLYSDPPQSQTDTLAYLLTGKAASQSSQTQEEMLLRAAASLGFAGGNLLTDRLKSTFGLTEARLEAGKSLNEAALTLGTYLNPRLFISYTIGLFESSSLFKLRYRIADSWRLEMESGVEGTGGDVLYTLER